MWRKSGGGRDCPRFREAISARLDGEDPGMADDVIDAHLARCPDCRHFGAVAAREHRRLRVRPAAPVPDLTEEIVGRLVSIGPPGAQPAPAHPSSNATGSRWRRPASIAAATVAVVGGGFGAGALLGGHLGSAPAPAGSGAVRQVAGSSPPVSGPVTSGRYPGAIVSANAVPKPEVTLTDTSGRPYDLARATAGRVTLVFFGYTHCPDLCPINMALTATALRDLPAAERHKITVVFITTDPARDTPAVLRAWLDRFNPNFVGLTGSMAAIHAAEEQVQMPLSYLDRETSTHTSAHTSGGSQSGGAKGQDYEVVHAAYTLVYAASGRANLTVDDTVHPDQYATTLAHVLAYGFRGPA